MKLLKPWTYLSAQTAHDLAPLGLKALTLNGTIGPGPTRWLPLEFDSLTFPNPLGVSGGVDKDGSSMKPWWALGAGFLEVGTVTPLPQTPNPGQILMRDLRTKTLWNKMGFPNKGVQALKKQLTHLNRPYPSPLFINIGKNRDTPNSKAHEDYVTCVQELRDFADGFVINISSPNTKGLRELLKPSSFRQFLEPILNEINKSHRQSPVTLLKVSPDMEAEDLGSLLDQSIELGLQGWVLTNTTTQRPQLSQFPTEGGLSGAPLKRHSELALKNLISHLGERKKNHLVISSGGVLSPQDVRARLDMGADLVQCYSALVFEGPWFFQKVAKSFKN